MSRLPLEVSISSPCTQAWDAMSGSSLVRHCDSCSTSVHNLTKMPSRQIEALVHASGGHFCGRMERNADGTLRTADQPLHPGSSLRGFVLAASLSLSTAAAAQDAGKSIPAVVTGTVVDATRAPIASATVFLFMIDGEEIQTKTDARGMYRIQTAPGLVALEAASPGLALNAFTAEIVAPVQVLAPIVLQAAPVDPAEMGTGSGFIGAAEETVLVGGAHEPRSVFTGVVTDNQGALVVGARVTVSLHGKVLGSTLTNEAGAFEFALAPDDYILQVTSAGFASLARPLSVPADRAFMPDLALTPGTEASVQVVADETITTTMGEMVSSIRAQWYQRARFRLLHPVAYAQALLRHR